MKIFHAILGLLALLFVGVQTLRHTYVLFVEPRESVLDSFDEVKGKIDSTESIEELVKLYAEARRKVQAANEEYDKKGGDPKEKYDYDRMQQEPFRSESQIRSAIEEREKHRSDVWEVHFYWLCGAVASLVGALAYLRVQRWAGLALCILGGLEMIWATAPAYLRFGWDLEFEQLLTLKLLYSLLTLVMLVAGWFIASKKLATLRVSG